jgi:hypothetical protein
VAVTVRRRVLGSGDDRVWRWWPGAVDQAAVTAGRTACLPGAAVMAGRTAWFLGAAVMAGCGRANGVAPRRGSDDRVAWTQRR